MVASENRFTKENASTTTRDPDVATKPATQEIKSKEDLKKFCKEFNGDYAAAFMAICSALMVLLPDTPDVKPTATQTVMEKKEETFEQIERRRSLVISGFKEDTNKTAQLQYEEDRNRLGYIFNSLNLPFQVTSFYRMGKVGSNGGSRLLKLVLPSSSLQREVLARIRICAKQAKNEGRKLFGNLHPDFDLSGTFIRPSLSLNDRIKGFALRLKRTNLAINGTTKMELFINYNEGKIVNKRTKEEFILTDEEFDEVKNKWNEQITDKQTYANVTKRRGRRDNYQQVSKKSLNH